MLRSVSSGALLIGPFGEAVCHFVGRKVQAMSVVLPGAGLI